MWHLASFYHSIPVGHIEALRTNNIYSPFPEEANRRLISQIANLHFAPTENAMKILEVLELQNIFMTGNTVVDSLNFILKEELYDSKFVELDKKENDIDDFS